MTALAPPGWRAPSRLSDVPVSLRCVFGGLALAASVPPWGWWPLAFVGWAVLDRLIADQPRAVRFRRTWLLAAAWLYPSILWMFDLTAPGYIVACAAYSAYFGVAAMITPAAAPWRWLALPGGVALAEMARWYFPFGGVPLSTMAMSQANSPLAPLVRLAGPLLLVLVVVGLGVAISAAIDRRWRTSGGIVGAVIVLMVAAWVAPAGSAVDTLDVAVIQGGGPQRTRASSDQPPIVFQRHVDATLSIDRPVDLILWPENVVNPGPSLDASEAEERLLELANQLDAPILPGWFFRVDGGTVNFHNVILPDLTVGDRYDKVRTVPFGEFVPLRSVLEQFSSALPQNDVIAGTAPAVLDTPAGRMGVSISWEIFFAHRARDAVGNGGEVLLNPTNGSSYWLTQVQSQQVASSQLRALETGRWVLQAAPTGFSAIVSPDGEVIERTGISEAKVLYATIERRSGLTLANRVGVWPVVLLAALGLVLANRLVPTRQPSEP
ncbi:MAG: apolipoprotein N-acyltransferase [Actinomycetia bacterium]|nr:apolipoprotein N-acyltransferase [Actinomycetes bacterium]MCP3913305.1 apolipoprotein N-acyltransferase [Actinomycetes bacterium]MCP4084804.1 apolipoprotein N-acyltransferase [Actinomycetes bacterium]